MEIKQLQAFTAVTRAGSFSRAAELLDYAQSSISAQIRLLEDNLGIRLFERLGRKVVLTSDGERLLPYAEQVLKLIAEAREMVAQSALPRGTLRIGAPESLCIARLPPVLKEYRRRYPEVELILKLGGSADLHRWLLDNSIDASFYLDRPLISPKLMAQTLLEEPIMLLAAPDHPITTKTPLRPTDLQGESLILTESGNSYRAVLDGFLTEAGIQPGSVLESGSIEAIKKLVISGLGVSLLPRMVVEAELQTGQLADLRWRGPDFAIRTQLVHHKDKWLSPALQALFSLTEELVRAGALTAGGEPSAW
ncbi:MAG TPA: LysR family transcriptional regulator [Symbiobacteriaceae bacterium]|nr:LysR family transcriptional regulator [Symbiobacteriaceae bacterium]